ncbi:hypothetical protein NQ317_003915 [Molorchus minor]|uniref:Uncharacterized protein n=1 Tax=Molorchus minor TaxID=1323400 RepID=A0ABQ9IPX2_9CUCU|nr:hypothetical protein NQ317_003915 [Molorchus minor]
MEKLKIEMRKQLQEMKEQQISTKNYNFQNHKFDGNINKIHPKVFVQIIINKVKHNKNNIEDIKETIRENLEKDALVWFCGKDHEIENIQDFENLFLKQFWGEYAQNSVREKLYFGKFNYNLSNSLNLYALRLYAIAKHLTPAMEESDIVLYISRHFKAEVAENLAIHNIKTMDQLSNYLNRIERNMNTTQRSNFPIPYQHTKPKH